MKGLSVLEQELARKRDYYYAHRERILKQDRQGRLRHPEAHRESCRRWRQSHPEVVREHQRLRRVERPELARAAGLRWRTRHPDVVVDNRLLYYYGISAADRNKIWVAQRGICPICLKPVAKRSGRNSCIDHEHKPGGRVRGVIHQRCNTLISYWEHVRATPGMSKRLDAYLRSPKRRKR